MRKPTFCICENKDADQLRGYREADQRLCFRYIDSIIPLLTKYEISSLEPSSVTVQLGLCRTLSETPKPGFLRTRLNGFNLVLSFCSGSKHLVCSSVRMFSSMNHHSKQITQPKRPGLKRPRYHQWVLAFIIPLNFYRLVLLHF